MFIKSDKQNYNNFKEIVQKVIHATRKRNCCYLLIINHMYSETYSKKKISELLISSTQIFQLIYHGSRGDSLLYTRASHAAN